MPPPLGGAWLVGRWSPRILRRSGVVSNEAICGSANVCVGLPCPRYSQTLKRRSNSRSSASGGCSVDVYRIDNNMPEVEASSEGQRCPESFGGRYVLCVDGTDEAQADSMRLEFSRAMDTA